MGSRAALKAVNINSSTRRETRERENPPPMLIAILSDIHANREAFDACMAHAGRQGAEHFVFLGDIVGYGADPSYVADQVASRVSDGAVAIIGNHDAALFEGTGGMNAYARAAIEWTERKLDSAQKAFLTKLPLSAEHGDALFVHSDASQPKQWIYVSSSAEAERSLTATDKHVTFCGHVHRPQLYHMAPGKPAVCFIPSAGVGIPLARSRRWLAVLGSVGQPRDETPSAAYALFDDARGVLSYHRVPYDIEKAAAKIKAAGLPAILSARLFIGR